MKETRCKCGRWVETSDECIAVQCKYCCHNKVAEKLREEREALPDKTAIKRKKAKKYYCAKERKKKSKVTAKCKTCKKKSGCELWSLRKK